MGSGSAGPSASFPAQYDIHEQPARRAVDDRAEALSYELLLDA
jgi:hypothetical protein